MKHTISKRALFIAAAIVVAATLAPSSASAQQLFGNAGDVAKNVTGQGLNVILSIVTLMGAAGLGTGLIGHWKQPDKQRMWHHVIEGSLIPLVGGAIALGYFNGAPALVGHI